MESTHTPWPSRRRTSHGTLPLATVSAPPDFQSILSLHLTRLGDALAQQHEHEVSFLKAQLQQCRSALSNQTHCSCTVTQPIQNALCPGKSGSNSTSIDNSNNSNNSNSSNNSTSSSSSSGSKNSNSRRPSLQGEREADEPPLPTAPPPPLPGTLSTPGDTASDEPPQCTLPVITVTSPSTPGDTASDEPPQCTQPVITTVTSPTSTWSTASSNRLMQDEAQISTDAAGPSTSKGSEMQLELEVFFDDHLERNISSSASRPFTSSDRMVTGSELKDASEWSQRLVCHPFSTHKIVHDLCTAAVMALDMTLIPLEVAGIVSMTPILYLLGLFVTIWWTFDMLLSFCTGYQHKGIVELRLSATACAYIRSWFTVDFLLVGMDWMTLILTYLAAGGLPQSAKGVLVSRAFRVVRLSRMFRLPKLFKILHGVQHWFAGDVLAAILKVGCWILGILFVNHFIACSWFALGTADEGIPSWVDSVRRFYREHMDHEANNWYIYTTSLHWSLTQFTPASMEVVPVNIYERVFAIFTIFGALVAFSSFLSSITNEVAALRLRRRAQEENQAQLVRYLSQNSVSLELGCRLQELASSQQAQSLRFRRIHEKDVTVLKQMPSSLKDQLRLEVFGPKLRGHPLMKTASILHEAPISSICLKAVSQKSLMPNEELFTLGKEAQFMYFVVAGQMVYHHGFQHPTEVVNVEPSHTFVAEESLCEHVLLCSWTHRGLLTAGTVCELVQLDAAEFRDAVNAHADIKQLFKQLGILYARTLSRQKRRPELTDVNLEDQVMRGLIIDVLDSYGLEIYPEDDDTGTWTWLTKNATKLERKNTVMFLE